MTHKHEVGQAIQFVADRIVTLPNGIWSKVKAGTEKVDGYWASLRRAVGQRTVNTGAADSQKRQRLMTLVRVHQ